MRTELIEECREAMQAAIDATERDDDPANLPTGVLQQLWQALHDLGKQSGGMSRLIQDGGGRWYVIPVSALADFNSWQQHRCHGHPWSGRDYEECRVNSPWEIRFDNWEAV